ncbi:hypothetical protein [Nocardioides montaniterrae]
MKVKDPHGQTWRITRRWVPWRRRLTGLGDSGLSTPLDWGSGLGNDPISAVIGVVLLILALPFIILGAVVAAEFFLLLLLLPFAALARVLFSKSWTVEARRGFEIAWDAPAGDWQASGIKIHEIADAIRQGNLPPGRRPAGDAVAREGA